MTGYALCGSFCTFSRSLEALENLIKNGYDIQPIMSRNAYETDTRFGTAESFRNRIEALCGRKIIHTVSGAEPLGPKIHLDLLVIAPCTGNTLAKAAAGITDTSVTMAYKAHVRCSRPVLIALATNDGMGANLKNLGIMAERKNTYFVPLSQDDPLNKPYSLVADFSLLEDSAEAALKGQQLRPLFI